MDKIDNKLMIHVAAEFVVLGGITYYLNNKINLQNERIAQLEAQNLYLKQMVENHDALLKNLSGKRPNRPQPQQPPKKPSKPVEDNSDRIEEEDLEEELKNNLSTEDYSEL